MLFLTLNLNHILHTSNILPFYLEWARQDHKTWLCLQLRDSEA